MVTLVSAALGQSRPAQDEPDEVPPDEEDDVPPDIEDDVPPEDEDGLEEDVPPEDADELEEEVPPEDEEDEVEAELPAHPPKTMTPRQAAAAWLLTGFSPG